VTPDLRAIYFAYLSVTAVLVLTPGSTTAVVMRNTLEDGRVAGLATAAGAAIANSTHATLAGLGLALLLTRAPSAIQVVRLAGAAYLAWLGAQSLVRAWREPDGGVRLPGPSGAPIPAHPVRHARDGLAVNLLNPSIVAFYVVVVPAFEPSSAPQHWYLLLAASHVGLALAAHSAWALALDRVRGWFHPPAARRTLEALTGLALVALSVRVML
jgi:threonine/homoserine/homoserine lactone efflux protein